MLNSVLLFLILTLGLELIINVDERGRLGNAYTLILLAGILLISLGFELFGLAVIIAYTSVFVSFFLLTYFLPTVQKYNKSTLLSISLLIGLVLLYQTSIGLDSVESGKLNLSIVGLNQSTLYSGKFNIVAYIVILKSFYMETLLLNFFLIIGLVYSLKILNKGALDKKDKLGPSLTRSIKRSTRRSPSFKKFTKA